MILEDDDNDHMNTDKCGPKIEYYISSKQVKKQFDDIKAYYDAEILALNNRIAKLESNNSSIQLTNKNKGIPNIMCMSNRMLVFYADTYNEAQDKFNSLVKPYLSSKPDDYYYIETFDNGQWKRNDNMYNQMLENR